MAAELDAGSVLVSATNGKTTTAAMIAAALERAGRPVVHNRAGSNMAWGVATALLDAGRERDQLGLFEVDEAWLPAVARDTDPRLLLLSNLFRDQLDRYGELELLADRWAELTAELDGRARFVLNADDPLVADLGRERERRDLLRRGGRLAGAARACSTPPTRSTAATAATRTSTRPIYLGHMGRYRCPNCGRTRPEPQVAATSVTLDGMSGSHVELRTPQGDARARACRSPASTTSTTPSPRRPRRWSSACRSRPSARRWRASAARSGAWRRSPWAAVRSRSS